MLNISQVILVRTDSNLCRKELTVHWRMPISLIRSYLQPCTNTMWGNESEAVAPIIWLYQTVDAQKEEVYFPDLLITLRRHVSVVLEICQVSWLYSVKERHWMWPREGGSCPTLASASHCEGGQAVHRVRGILPQVYSKLFGHRQAIDQSYQKSLSGSSGINTVKGLFRSSRRSGSLPQYFHIQWGMRVTLFWTLMPVISPWGLSFHKCSKGRRGWLHMPVKPCPESNKITVLPSRNC